MKKCFSALLFLFIPLAVVNAKEMNLKVPPAVFAVEKEYQIMITTSSPSLIRIKVGEKFYSDHINGVRPSQKSVHRFRVPMSELDKAGKYTVFSRKLPNRLPYMNKLTPQPEHSKSFQFDKLPQDNIKICNISDVHDRLDQAVSTVLAAGKADLLILNGDLIDKAIKFEQMEYPCILAGRMTNGRIPVIYARGNHELRGEFAENVQDYVPNVNGRLYYQVELGPLWILVLDAGEDKVDERNVYGNAIDCALFRREQLEFIKQTAAKGDYKKSQVKFKLIVSHSPFARYVGYSRKDEVEKRRFMIFKDWCEVLKEQIKPDFMISGHIHRHALLNEPHYPAPVLLGARPPRQNTPTFACSLITLFPAKADVKIIDGNKKVEAQYTIPFKR